LNNQVKEDEMGRVCRTKEEKNMCRLLVGKPEGKRPLGKPRQMWVGNIKVVVGEIGWGGANWIGLAQDRDKWRACEFDDEPSRSIKCQETIKWLHSWWPLNSAQLHRVS
jgi:hypothetical protein